jgi:hypothetical protein
LLLPTLYSANNISAKRALTGTLFHWQESGDALGRCRVLFLSGDIHERIHPVAFLLSSASQALLDEVSTENYNCVDPRVLIYKK